MFCHTIRIMKIYEFIEPEDRVEHIARHGLVAIIVKKTPGENYARDDP